MEWIVRLEEVTLAREGRVVLGGVSWRIAPGQRWAVWGPNGSGKSSLLQLLAGELTASVGEVRRLPGVRIAHVGQDALLPPAADLQGLIERGVPSIDVAERALREEERRLADGHGDLHRYAALQEAFERVGGYAARARLRTELARVLPDRAPDASLRALTASERRLVALTLALADRPDLLLLDEPTNRLDAPSRAWLEHHLQALPNDVALVVASHDRDLLAAVSTCSARVQDGRVDPVERSFEDDRDRRGAIRRSAEARARRDAREAERLARSAEVARRHGSPRRAAAARSLDRRAGRRVESARAARAEGDAQATPTAGAPLPALGREGTGPLLRARDLSLPGALDPLSLDLDAGEKVVLIGRDDPAVPTLLRLLAAEIPPTSNDAEIWLRPGARVLHWDVQRRGLRDDEPVRTQLTRWVREPRADALLALVGLPHERWDALPGQLSGGQRSRAALALVLAAEPDLVLLDRPEADLDLAALEQLEQALVDARTAVVMATHDLRLADAVSTDARSLEDGHWVAWRGGVAGWRSGRRRRELPQHGPPPRDAAAEGSHSPDADALEDEQAAIEALLEDPTRVGRRERARLEARLHELTELRMRAYDAGLPAPAPRYRAVEPPLEVFGDLVDGRLVLTTVGWPSEPSLRSVGDVVHLVLPDPTNGCWSRWARVAALRACLSLIVPVLAPTAVQTPAGTGPPPAPFTALDDDWWIVTRLGYERWSGWRSA